MTEVVTGSANLAQIAIQGNRLEAAAQYMAQIYTRNDAQQQLFAPNVAQSEFPNGLGPRGLEMGPPVFLETQGDLELDIYASQSSGGLRLSVRLNIFVY